MPATSIDRKEINMADKYSFSGMDYLAQIQKNKGVTVLSAGIDNELGSTDRHVIEQRLNEFIQNLPADKMATIHVAQTQSEIKNQIYAILSDEKEKFTATLHSKIDDIGNRSIDALFGYGVIQSLVNDPDVTEIMVNGIGKGTIYYEKDGQLEKYDNYFNNMERLKNVINLIVGAVNRRVDESSPIVDARLPDGSRVNAVIPPIAIDGPYLTIRKFKKGIKMEQLVKFGALTQDVAIIIEKLVKAKCSLFIYGGTGSGKTTFLNACGNFIPAEERVITIEDTAELQIDHPHVLREETRPPNTEGKGAVLIPAAVKTALRQRPNRIIVGEVRGEEAADMLEAMNTGHEGSMGTGHANSPGGCINRIEDMCKKAGMDKYSANNRMQEAIAAFIEVQRLPNAKRRVKSITAPIGLDANGKVILTYLYKYNQLTDKLEWVCQQKVQNIVEKLSFVDLTWEDVFPEPLGGEPIIA